MLYKVYRKPDKTTENIIMDDLSNEEDYDFNNRNYGRKLTCLWVFGMCQRRK